MFITPTIWLVVPTKEGYVVLARATRSLSKFRYMKAVPASLLRSQATAGAELAEAPYARMGSTLIIFNFLIF